MMRIFGSGRKTRKQKQPSDSGDAVSELFRRLNTGEIATAGLMKKGRQRFVENLTIEGYFTSEIAELLGVSDRTVRRDLRAIRASHSVERNPETVMEMVGRLVWQADVATNRICRAVRLKTVKPSDRIEAEHTCWRIVKQLVEMLQRLGYMPDFATSSPTIVPQNVSSLNIFQQMISQAREQKLIEAGMPPGTTSAEKVRVLAAIDDLLSTEGISPGGGKVKSG